MATLRSWRQQVITVVNDLGGKPEPLKLLSSLRMLISSLVSSDNAFATEVAQISRTTQVKNNCTDENLLQTMGMLEIELASRAQAQEDDEERRKGVKLITLPILLWASIPEEARRPQEARQRRRRRKDQEKARMKDQETTNQYAPTI